MNLDEAIEAAATQGATDGGSSDPGPAVVDAPAGGTESATAPPVAADADGEPAGGPGKSLEGRDEKGRFKPGAKPPAKAETTQVAPPEPGATTPTPVPAPGTESVALKAPQGWSPEEREEWGKLTPAAQKAITRREEQADQLAKDAAGARSVVERLERSVGPYRDLLDPNDPFATLSSLLHTSKQLQYGAPAQKQGLLMEMAKRHGVPIDANFTADLIRSQGVDIDQLAKALDGQPQGAAHHAAASAPITQEQIKQWMQEGWQQMQGQHQQQAIGSALEAFGRSHEYFKDLEPTMAGLINGGICSRDPAKLDEAYQYALNLPKHADIKKLVDQKAKAAAVTQGQAARSVAGPRPEPASGPRVRTNGAMTLDQAIAAGFSQGTQ